MADKVDNDIGLAREQREIRPGRGRQREDIRQARKRNYGHSTSSTSTATPSFCFGEPTMMPSTGDTSEKSRPTASMM